MNAAQKDLRTAELAVKAADARIKYYEAYRGWLKVHWRHTQEDMYWREAQFELAKADLGKKNNIAPKGVNYESFPKQEADRNKRAQSSKQKAEGSKGKAASAREEWLKSQQTADQASGKPSGYPDPMGGAATTAG
jgi:multidrug resistance efflux pump